MKDLIDFLEARLAEDEQIAQAVDDNSPPWTGEWIVRDTRALGTRNGWCLAYPHEGREFAPGLVEHIARHDPARALREVAAHRKVLVAAEGAFRSNEYFGAVEPAWRAVANHYWGVLGMLAEIYSDHPHYRKEWAA